MEPTTLALLSAVLGAVVGAAASTLGSMSVERAGRRRAIRAGQLRELVPSARQAVDAGLEQLRSKRGPVQVAHIVTALEAIEREALTAGSLDAERAQPLVDIAHELWRLDREIWEDDSLARDLRVDAEWAIDAQLRLLARVAGRVDNYEGWLRRHLIGRWWRRGSSMPTTP